MKDSHEELRKNFEKNFLKIIDEDIFSALFLWRKFYLALNNLKLPEDIRKTLLNTYIGVKKNLIASQVQRLWNALFSSEVENFLKGKKSIQPLKNQVIRDIDMIRHVQVEQLLSLNEEETDLREIFIALIRKHLNQHQKEDPFEKDFNYDLLQEVDSKGNLVYIGKFIKKCTLLPTEDIILLAKKNQTVAKELLTYITDSDFYFEISGRIGEIYANLRPEIVKQWKNYLQTFPLTKEQKVKLNKQLKELQKKYPEYQEVNLHTRVKRFYRKIKKSSYYDMMAIGAINLATAFVYIPYLIKTGKIVLCSKVVAKAAISPVAASYFISPWLAIPAVVLAGGGGYAIKKYYEQQSVQENVHIAPQLR